MVHAGAYAAEGNTTVGSTYATKSLPSTYACGYLRAYIRIVSATSQANLLRFRTAAAGSIRYVYVTASWVLALRNDVGGPPFISTTMFTFETWHSLDVHFIIDGASGHTEVWLDSNPSRPSEGPAISARSGASGPEEFNGRRGARSRRGTWPRT